MVANRIILFMPVLDPDSQGLLHYWPFELHIQAETLDAQGTGELAFADLSILPSFTTFWTVTCSPDALTEGARDVILCLHPRGCAIQFPIEGTAMFAHASII